MVVLIYILYNEPNIENRAALLFCLDNIYAKSIDACTQA